MSRPSDDDLGNELERTRGQAAAASAALEAARAQSDYWHGRALKAEDCLRAAARELDALYGRIRESLDRDG